MGTVWRVFAYLKRYPLLAVGTLTCAVVGTLMVIVFPAVTKRVIDEVLVQHRPERLTPLVLIAALAFFLQHGLNSLRIVLNNTFEQKVIFDLRSDLYSHIQMLPLRWFDNRATGDLMTRILEDVNSVERMLIDGVEQGVVAVLQAVIVLGMMIYFSPSLTLVGLAPAPFLQGKLQRLTTPRIRVTGEARFADRRVDGQVELRSPALAVNAKGVVDLARSRFDPLRLDANLLKPAALFPNMSGRNIRLQATLAGAFARAAFRYWLTSPP